MLSIFSTQPSWRTDGLGIRGPQNGSGQPTQGVGHFYPSAVTRPVPTSPIGNSPIPFAKGDGVSYPWIGSLYDTDDKQYFGWFGNTTYVSPKGAADLKAFKAIIQDINDSNASQGFISIGDPDSSQDGIVFNYGGSTLKLAWLDSDGNGNPEVYLQNASDAYFSIKTDQGTMCDSLSSPQHSFGFKSTYLDYDSQKVMLGFDPNDSDYKLIIAKDGSHAFGAHSEYLDFDSSKVFLGYDTTDSQYKLTLNDGTLGSGFMTGYLELASQKVFLGYSSSEQTTHLTIVSDTAYIELGTASQGFFGYGSDSTWHLALPDAGYLIFGDSVFLGKGSDGTHHLELSSAGAYCKVSDDGYYEVGTTNLSDDLLTMGDTTEYADDHLKFDTTNLSEDLLKMGSTTEYADDHIKLNGTVGSAGAILVSDGSKSAWADLGAANGDILIYNGGWYALGKGTDGDVLMMQSGLPAWVTPSTC